MGTLKITNNASSTLAGAITSSATSVSVQVGDGAKYPSLGSGDWFPLTIVNASGGYEIVKCTARTGDILTVARAQEGTAGTAFSAGARVDLRLTAAALASMVPIGTPALVSNNLSDLQNAATARINLGLGDAATHASTDFATAAQGTLASTALQASSAAAIATSGKYNDILPGWKLGESFTYGTISNAGWLAATKIFESCALGWNIVTTGHFGHIGYSGDTFYVCVSDNNSINGTASVTYLLSVNTGGAYINGAAVITGSNIGSQSVNYANAAGVAYSLSGGWPTYGQPGSYTTTTSSIYLGLSVGSNYTAGYVGMPSGTWQLMAVTASDASVPATDYSLLWLRVA